MNTYKSKLPHLTVINVLFLFQSECEQKRPWPKGQINETLELYTSLDTSRHVLSEKHEMYIVRLRFFDWITRISVFHRWFAVVTGFWHILNKHTRSNLVLLIRDINIFSFYQILHLSSIFQHFHSKQIL